MSWRNLLLEAVRRAFQFICHREQSLDLSELGGFLRHLTAARRVLAKGPMVVVHRLHNGHASFKLLRLIQRTNSRLNASASSSRSKPITVDRAFVSKSTNEQA